MSFLVVELIQKKYGKKTSIRTEIRRLLFSTYRVFAKTTLFILHPRITVCTLGHKIFSARSFPRLQYPILKKMSFTQQREAHFLHCFKAIIYKSTIVTSLLLFENGLIVFTSYFIEFFQSGGLHFFALFSLEFGFLRKGCFLLFGKRGFLFLFCL